MRTTLLAALALVALAGCAGPNASSAPAQSATPAAPATPSVSVVLADFKIEPSSITAAGPTLTIAVKSNGPTPHNFTVRDASNQRLAGTDDLSTGESATLTANLPAGEYTFFCALAGHESLGMRGTLTVTGS